jgi:hypothetical protein
LISSFRYKGKSIGKHVFLSRSTVNGIGKPDIGGPSNKTKLQELEIKFYKSLFRESEASMMAPPFLYNPVMHSGHQVCILVFLKLVENAGVEANRLFRCITDDGQFRESVCYSSTIVYAVQPTRSTSNAVADDASWGCW